MTNKYLSKIAKTDIDATGTGLDNAPKAPRTTLKEPVKPLPTLAKEAGLGDKARAGAAFLKQLRPEDKIKLGLSSAGLGLGTAGFAASMHQRAKDEKRHNLEAQSLSTLRKIHEALAAKDKPV